MAKKAQKSQATRNAAKLLQTHCITGGCHLLFHLRRLLLSSPASRSSLTAYGVLILPALALEAYLEKIGRPTFGENGVVRSSGSDLDGKGVMEWIWDVIYWTWINLGLVTLFGDKAWYLWVVVPGYSIWLVYSTIGGLKQGLGGAGGVPSEEVLTTESKRQKKLEKRGGQKVQYAR